MRLSASPAGAIGMQGAAARPISDAHTQLVHEPRQQQPEDAEHDQKVKVRVQSVSGGFTALPRLNVATRVVSSQATAEIAAAPSLAVLDDAPDHVVSSEERDPGVEE
jgi:hypothetical protein